MLIQQAKESGIEMLLLPNVDETTIRPMLDLCKQYSDFTFPMMGLHPTSVHETYVSQLQEIESYLGNHKFCAIGEIGIDLYWDKSRIKEQTIAFEEQLKWSIDLELPVAIHTRDAFREVLDSIYRVGPDKLRGVFHSFGGNISDLEEVKKLSGFKIGINGVVTFKNSGLSDVIRQTDIHHIVFETDAPYLSPVPFRGKRNEPAYIWKTVEKVAEIYELSLQETVDITRQNALKLFRNINKNG